MSDAGTRSEIQRATDLFWITFQVWVHANETGQDSLPLLDMLHMAYASEMREQIMVVVNEDRQERNQVARDGGR